MARVEPWQGVLGFLGAALLAWAVLTPPPEALQPEPGSAPTGATGAVTTVRVDPAALQGAPGQPVAVDLAGRQAQLWRLPGDPPHYQGVVLPEGAPATLTVLPEGLRGFALLPDGVYVFEPAGPGAAAVHLVPL